MHACMLYKCAQRFLVLQLIIIYSCLSSLVNMVMHVAMSFSYSYSLDIAICIAAIPCVQIIHIDIYVTGFTKPFQIAHLHA